MTGVVFCWCRFLQCFLNPTFANFLVSEETTCTNLKPIWVPKWSQSQQICKSENCSFAQEGTLKSSFPGSVFHNYSSFFDTCCRDLQCSPFIRCIYHIIFNLWTHMASIWDSNLAYFALHFSNDFFVTGPFPR